jgi:DNA-binding GntR family transcriptional regulator
MIVVLTFGSAEPPKEPSLVAQPWSSLGNIAYEAIVEGILTGSLPAGTQISIDGSARQLKMSNTPVREALTRLAAERLVLFSANKGYTVTPRITAEEYHQLFGARRTLELASIKSAIIEPTAIGKIASILHRHPFTITKYSLDGQSLLQVVQRFLLLIETIGEQS